MNNQGIHRHAMLHQLSRRSVLTGLAALGIVAPMAGQVFAASAGDTLTANMKDPPNFDIIGNSTSWVILSIGPCYNGLVTRNPENLDEIIGELAENWQVSEDGLVYTFKLREGVEFHDGQPFSSADVKASFDMVRNPPEGTVSVRKSSLSAVESIEAPDATTVIFRLHRPQSAFLQLLATGWMVVMPKHILDRDGNMQKEVIGTGPFKFKDYQRGVRLELVRNEKYFMPDQPGVDAITLFVAEDPSSLDAYFRTGQIMLYNEMSSDSGLRFENAGGGVNVQRVVALNPTGFCFNGRSAPFDDKRLRQAVSYAINREEAIQFLEQGQAVVGGFVPPGKYALPAERLAQMPGYGADKEANLAKARELLAAAGKPDGFECSMLVRKNQNHEERAVMLQGQLARVGIKVKLEVQESAMFFEKFNAGQFQLVSQGGMAYPVNDPEVVFGDVHTQSPGNVTGIYNPEIDRLFVEQSKETDDARRIEISHQMEEIALDECARVVLFFQNKFVGLSDRVSGYKASGNPDDSSRLATVKVGPKG